MSTSRRTASSPDSSSPEHKFYNATTHPLASALAVFNDPSRHLWLLRSIRLFMNQTWPLKEMVIINGTEKDFNPLVPNVRVIKVRARHLGDYKNIARQNSVGEWCLPWPDDCIVDDDYIEFHMQHRSKSLPVGVRNPMAKVAQHPEEETEPEFAPFISFFRFSTHDYDADGSDYQFVLKHGQINWVDGPPKLAVRLFAGYANAE